MKRSTHTAALVATLALGPLASPGRAQGIEDSLRQLGLENARLYAHPVVAGLGAALNSGFYHTGRVHQPLGFDLGVRAMGAFIPRPADTFVPVLPTTVEYEGETYAIPYGVAPGSPVESPTAAGEGEGIVLGPLGEFRQALLDNGEDPRDFEIRFPRGFDVPAVPMAVIQLAVGAPYGTEGFIRFLPSVEVHEDVGSVGLFGFGLKHSVSQWFSSPPPLDLAVLFGWQRFTVGEYLEARALSASLVASRDVAFLTLYAGATVEDANVDIRYTVENPTDIPGLPAHGEVISFTDEPDNSGRFTVGTTFNVLALRLNVDYSFADYNVLTVNLLVSYR